MLCLYSCACFMMFKDKIISDARTQNPWGKAHRNKKRVFWALSKKGGGQNCCLNAGKYKVCEPANWVRSQARATGAKQGHLGQKEEKICKKSYFSDFECIFVHLLIFVKNMQKDKYFCIWWDDFLTPRLTLTNMSKFFAFCCLISS